MRVEEFRVSQAAIAEAIVNVDDKTARALRQAAAQIRDFHERQKQQSWFTVREDGALVGSKVEPLESVGIYVPGGRALYPSSVLMNALPAAVAGVKRIVCVTPPTADGTLDPAILEACRISGVTEIYAVGGAQAIAALAYGTESIAPVAKITGPILAINGLADTTVTPDNADQIVAASKNENSRTYFIENCDHTFNVFSGDDTALTDAIYAGIGFLENTFNGGIGAGVTSVSKYGNVTTNIPAYQFAGAGFELGDILNVTVGDTTVQAPYGDAYSNVDNGNVVILADGDGYVTVAINMGNFSGTYGAEVGSYLEFTMAEKAGYLEEYEIRNIDSLRTNERDDYASDEVFANFRPVVMGDIPAGILYRSSSPVNPELGRNSYADKLAEAAEIKTVLNLADSLEVLEAYEGYAGTYYATLNVAPLDMGVDFAAEEFNAKLKTGLVYLIDNEGPYLIHCNEGKDRAGFVAALLEALGGAEAEEIVEDYMLSYENYYHVEHHSDRWYSIANSNIIKTLCTLTGTETEEEMKQADLRQAAETYLMGTVGLTAEQVAAVRTAITTPVTAEAAA